MSTSNTKRFSNRVNDYVKYRPGYPEEMLSYLQESLGLIKTMKIADIGAGTGISAELFLKAGYTVTAVEPNREMREKAVELLSSYPAFLAVNGTSEATTLADHSIDAVIAAQAFHWFDKDRAKKEFLRILNDRAIAVFIWNERLTSSSFEKDYDALIIKHGKDYVAVDHRNIDEASMQLFFSPQACTLKIFHNHQDFDFEGLKGRLVSSSYMPSTADAGFDAMIADLQILFARYQHNGTIRINYETKVYAGKLR